MRFLLASLTLSLAACSSQQQESDEYGGRFQERLGRQMKAMKSQDLESPFQKAYDSESTVKTGTSSLQRKGFRSTDYSGFDRDFNGGSHAARTKQFAQSDRTSPTGNRQFAGTQEDRDAGQLFRSRSSPADGQTARQSSQVASGMDREFTTSDVRDAAKSQQKNVRPLIVEPKTNGGKAHDYSEDQVRAFMSRD